MSPGLRQLMLMSLAGLSVAHIAYFGTWAVEDAAISWAYAQNIADGHGAVPWVGSEPVEGYSNPLWVALLALAALVGVHPFWSSKLLAMAMTAVTVLLVDRIGRRVMPTAPDAGGLAAAALFAVHSQVGIYGAAGLENPLFNLCLAAGLARLFDEHEAPGPPWSALWFTALATTRPDGIGYAVLIGLLTTLARIRAGRDRVEISRWWLALLGPLFAYNLGRWAYFGWELPATAYAKLKDDNAHLWLFHARGWVYTREWVVATGQWMFGGFYVLALTRTRGRGPLAAFAIVGTAALLYGLPNQGSWVAPARVAFPLLAGAALWLGAVFRDEHDRGVLLAVTMSAVFFAIYAPGDWMKGGRWFSMAAVPSSVLLAAGMVELVGTLNRHRLRPARQVLLVALVLSFFASQLSYSRWFGEVLEISPWSVRNRVWQGQEIAERVGIDERPRVLTVDMGAFLMWSGWEHNDIVGLTDMPMAHNRHAPWFTDFFATYILEERQPHLIALGGVEATLRRMPAFTDQYFVGRYRWRVRTDLVFDPEWTGTPGRRVDFEGATLEGWEAPSLPTLAGGSLALEIGVRVHDGRLPLWTARLVDPGGAEVAIWRLPHEGPPIADWPRDAVYHGRHTLDLPDDLPDGSYRLTLAMRTRDALNQPDPTTLPAGASLAADRTVVFEAPIRIAGSDEVRTAVAAGEAESLGLAQAGDCDASRTRATHAAHHGLPPSEGFETRLNRALATCWLDRAGSDADEAIAHLERARRLDPTAPGLPQALQREADRLQRVGDEASDSGKRLVAYRAYRDVLRLDPSRTWIRRAAEDLRSDLLSSGAPP